jgi:trimethylamine--corrinoid protein Co-methyltransferase
MRPKLQMIDEKLTGDIVNEAMDVLTRIGVFIEDDELMDLLHGAGARVERNKQRAFIPGDLVENCLKTVPLSIDVFDTSGQKTLELAGDTVHYNPGSAALWILDPETKRERVPVTRDLINLALVVNECSNLAAQSTSLIPDDVPRDLSDSYRLFLALLFSRKPTVTGTFTLDSYNSMKNMLLVVSGGEKELSEKPIAIFDACPSPPLMWSTLTSNTLVGCAKSGVPAELVSMPLTGAIAPVTITGALVQHTAENLSGIVIHQLSGPGSPIIYGGSPSAFDMRKGTTPMGAVETMMIDMAYSQIGKHLGLPTHAYMGLSDSKMVDTQSGFESGAGIILGGLAGINVISGPGMLDFESCQSLEKLLIDDQICGMAFRLMDGVKQRSKPMGFDTLKGAVESERPGEYFLTSPDTLRWFKEELFFPDKLVDRLDYGGWLEEGAKDIFERACSRVEKLTTSKPQIVLEDDKVRGLKEIMERDLRSVGMDGLPAAIAEFLP